MSLRQTGQLFWGEAPETAVSLCAIRARAIPPQPSRVGITAGRDQGPKAGEVILPIDRNLQVAHCILEDHPQAGREEDTNDGAADLQTRDPGHEAAEKIGEEANPAGGNPGNKSGILAGCGGDQADTGAAAPQQNLGHDDQHHSHNEGLGIEPQAITAAFPGGFSLQGGRGTVIGALRGVAVIGVLKKGMFPPPIAAFCHVLAKGSCLFLAVLQAEYCLNRSG